MTGCRETFRMLVHGYEALINRLCGHCADNLIECKNWLQKNNSASSVAIGSTCTLVRLLNVYLLKCKYVKMGNAIFLGEIFV